MKLTPLCMAALLAFGGTAFAQTATEPATSPPEATTPVAPDAPSAKTTPADETLSPGANSFTEAQAKSWLEDAGYTDVSGLAQSEDGIWRGHARRNGTTVAVAVDYKGTISTD